MVEKVLGRVSVGCIKLVYFFLLLTLGFKDGSKAGGVVCNASGVVVNNYSMLGGVKLHSLDLV